MELRTQRLNYGCYVALSDYMGDERARKIFGMDADQDPIVHFGLEEERDDILVHYGTPRHSGRYPWGSGENPYQRLADFKGHVDRLRKKGFSDVEIAKSMKMTTSVMRAKISMAEDEMRKAKANQAVKLREKGYSYQAIADRMGLPNESSVRSLLDKKASVRSKQTQVTLDTLKKAVEEDKFVDVGAGVEKYLGISNTKLKNAVILLEEQGYKVHKIYQIQQGTGRRTTIKVLTKNDVKYGEVAKNKDAIVIPNYRSEDHGYSYEKLDPPKVVDPKRIMVRYGDEGGSEKDGLIELRRGVDDISMGKALYTQVRIATSKDGKDGAASHYLKGMAVYSDNMPDGIDIIYNSKKPTGTELFGTSSDSSVFKPIKAGADPTNPFGATIKNDRDLVRAQRHYIDKDGNKQQSCLNIVNEEGNWDEWSRNLSSQFLSKQSPSLIKSQLKKAYDIRKEEFDEINSLTNPVIKAKLAAEFAESCDSAAVHLKGAAMPRQRSQVILPFPDLKENECYAPNFKDGETVVAIRYPHAGPFEIAEMTVNNRFKHARDILKRPDGSDAMDAVGIHPKAAQKLSGADFDGDTVILIPNNDKRVKTMKSLEELRDFDTDRYALPHDAPPVDADHGFNKQLQMGLVSNLITDMTIKGADYHEIARAVKHSMVIIDAEKHHLDWKQSALENDIAGLKTKYQGGPNAGASTLISKASSEEHLKSRRLVTNPKRMTPEQRERYFNGEKIYEETGRTFKKKNEKTGEWEEHPSMISSTKMAEERDAYNLSSGTPQEAIYASFANKLKSLANESRKLVIFQEPFEYDPSAKQAYFKEVKSLSDKLFEAERNRPLERKAQLLANKWVQAAKEADPSMDADDIKKLKGRKLDEARQRVGAKKELVEITPREWEAIQARAISKTMLTRIFNNTDTEKLKEYSMPRSAKAMSAAKVSRAKSLMSQGKTTSEIADVLGVSVSTLQKALYGS